MRSCPAGAPGQSRGSGRTLEYLQPATLPSCSSSPHPSLFQSFLLTPGGMIYKCHLLKGDLQISVYLPTLRSFTWNEVILTLLLYTIFDNPVNVTGTERDQPFFLHIIKLSAVIKIKLKRKIKKCYCANSWFQGPLQLEIEVCWNTCWLNTLKNSPARQDHTS